LFHFIKEKKSYEQRVAKLRNILMVVRFFKSDSFVGG